MATAFGIPSLITYPAIRLCGHSLEYQIKTAAQFFCTGCEIGVAREAAKEAKEQMPWATWEQRRGWIVQRVREAAARG